MRCNSFYSGHRNTRDGVTGKGSSGDLPGDWSVEMKVGGGAMEIMGLSGLLQEHIVPSS